MNRDDMILISVDGTDVWKFRDHVIPNSALNAIAGRPKEEYGLEPQGLDEYRRRAEAAVQKAPVVR